MKKWEVKFLPIMISREEVKFFQENQNQKESLSNEIVPSEKKVFITDKRIFQIRKD